MALPDSAFVRVGMEVFWREGTDFIRECGPSRCRTHDAEATSVIGAGRCERSGGAGRPNVTVPVRRLLTTHAGDEVGDP